MPKERSRDLNGVHFSEVPGEDQIGLQDSGEYEKTEKTPLKSHRKRRRWCSKWAETLCVFTASIGVIADGIQYGWSSPAIPLLMRDDSPVKIYDSDVSLLEILYMAGGICGLPITMLIVDKLGRKKSIITATFLNFLSWILIGVATERITLLVARFICGIAANLIYVSSPMYIAEVADAKIRGFLTTFFYIMMIVGVLVAYCVVPFIPIYASSIVAAAIGLTQMVTFMWMPESPYYSLIRQDKETARESLKWLRQRDDVEEELEDIETAVIRQNSERGRMIDLLIIPSNRKALIIMGTLNTAQHFCGISVIIMNVQMIISESGSVISNELSAILFGVAMLIASFMGGIVIDRYGRKILLVVSSILTSVVLGIMATYFFLKDVQKFDLTDYKAIPMFTVLLYAFVYKCGLGLVPIVTTSELFPTSVKAMGMTISDMLYIIMGLVSLQVYYVTMELQGIYLPFLLFCLFGLFTAGFCYWVIPETKGKTLEEIQHILKGHRPPQI